MDEQNDYGSWTPTEGGFRKTCRTCKRSFVGRKNRFYCGDSCKARKNNDLAFKRKQKVEAAIGPHLKNIKVLSQVFQSQKEPLVVASIEQLKFLGFDDKALCTPITWAGEEWYRLGQYAFKPSTETNEVEIRKLQ